MTLPPMEYRALGRCGTKVSALGLGGWTTFGNTIRFETDAELIITRAYEAGVNFFDIADIYAHGASETMMGNVLKKLPRHGLVISSKLFWPMSDDINDRGLSRKHIMESVHKSLRRIGTDYLDIYFCHRWDEHTPLEETVRAMDDLVHQGKILYWGTSEWTGAQLDEVNKLAGELRCYRPQVEQPQYSLIARHKFETDVAPAAQRHGMGTVVWSPLGSGILTGKYDSGFPPNARLTETSWLRESVATDQNLDRVRKMAAIAQHAGTSRAKLAIAWTLAQPGVSSVILGARTLDQLNETLAARNVKIEQDTMLALQNLFA